MPTTKTRTAKSARPKLALTLLSALVVLASASFAVYAATKSGFTLKVSPATQTVNQGQAASYSVTLTRDAKFTGTITLSASGLPTGATATFSPNPVAGSGTASTLIVKTNVGGTTPPGTYTFTVKGSSSQGSSSATAKLTVASAAQPSFTLTASPTTRTLSPSDSGSFALTLSRSGGFAGGVTLSASGLPAGMSAGFAPNPIGAGATASTVTFATTSKAKPGTFPITIVGTGQAGSSTLTRSTTVTVIVEEKKPFQIAGNVPGQLFPGVPVPLDLALTNPTNSQISITGLSVVVDPQTSRSGCSGTANFATTQIPANRFPITVPANSTRTLTQLGLAGARPTVMLSDLTGVNQDACKGATIHLNYSGTATK